MQQRELPEGTVTFVFTDIEGSTRMATDDPDGFRRALSDHNELLRVLVASFGGTEVRTEGDSFFVVFRSAPDAVAFAAAAQRALADHSWPASCEIRVRIGIHTGSGVRADHDSDDYVGIHVHRAARIEAAAHGGQVLISEATRAVAEPDLEGISLLDLGEHALKDLDEPEHLYQLVIPGLQSRFPVLRSISGAPNNLPEDLTSFVGREIVLADAVKALETTRLLTLTGPGGTGKTRLSLEIGRDRLPDFDDGVFFVDLADIRDPGLVAAEILNTIGLRAPSGTTPEEHLARHLASRRALLILDNFEQIIEAAPLVSQVLAGSPDLKIVVTSRAALHVRGEQELAVPPLALPDAGGAEHPEALQANEAVALFLHRAAAVRPDFVLDHDNAGDVARLVTRLDGLPLAIELAAARVKAFPVGTILERLDRGMLEGSSRDLPERQRTITAAIRWSYELLSGSCRRLFERFSVFVGGADLDEIEAVCGPSEDLGGDIYAALTELVDQSLLIPPGRGGDLQYRMLVTIRDFAWARLEEGGEANEMQRRHLDAYLALAERAAPHLVRSEQASWLDRLGADHDNLRAALVWGISSGDTDSATRLVGAAWRFWQIRGHVREGFENAEEVLGMTGGDPRHRLAALEAAGGLGYWRGGNRYHAYYTEAVEIARALGDPRALANALYNQSFGWAVDEIDRGLEGLNEALEIYRGLGDIEGMARVHWGIGNVYALVGDQATALGHFERSVAEFTDSDLAFDRGWALFALGFSHLQSGNGAEAEGFLRQSMAVFRGAADVSAIVMHLSAFAATALQQGDPQRGYRLAGATTTLREATGYGLVDAPENRYEGLAPENLRHLEGRDAAAFAEGRSLSSDEAIEYALGEIDIGGRA